MEIVEEQIVALALLMLKKAKLEKKLKKCITCSLRRCFSFLGFKQIEVLLEDIENQITQVKMELTNLKPMSKVSFI